MLSWFLPPVRLVASALAAHDSPRQLAAGISLGMVLGLVPKGNLTALLLGVLLFTLRINLGMGLAAACVFSWVGMSLDPIAHRLGWQILSYQPLQGVFAWCQELPLAPWTSLNNTVVLGQLVLGLYVAYPAYCLALWACHRWRDTLAARIRQYRVTRTLLGVEAVSRLKLGE